MIKNYIFDFGNVLAKFCPDDLSSRYFPEEQERRVAAEIIFDRLYWDKLDSGDISDSEVEAAVCARLNKKMQARAVAAYRGWIKNLTPIQGMEQLVFDLKQTGAKLYLLSNISERFANKYKEVPWIAALFSNFNGLVFSAPIGLTKPNREIFDYLLKKYNLNADECLFIDDAPRNIAGAEKAGIHGYLFDGDTQKLRKYLKI
jgi:putative hydrolase of the HAD superfamily